MRAVISRDAGLRTDRRISHVFHMSVPDSDKVLMITDGAVNVAPDERTLMDIVHNSVGLAKSLGYDAPKIAMLSAPADYTTLDGQTLHAEQQDVAIRMISMGQAHRAVTLTGSMCTAVAAALLALPAQADTESVATQRPVAEVMDRLEAAVADAGATVFARVDHAKGASDAGMEMADSQVLIFGNPKLGSQPMQQDIRAGLYLPMKMLVYRDGDQTQILWQEPEDMFDDLDLDGRRDLFITNGIHQHELGKPGRPDPGKVRDRLAAEGLSATHFMPALAW